MSLQSLPKTSSFTKRLTPDPRVPTVAVAKDPNTSPEVFHIARRLTDGAFTYCKPTPRKEYHFITASPAALDTLGLDQSEASSKEFQQIVSGEKVITDPFPYAQAYAGYQFGQFAGQLGDGRVVNLFEVQSAKDGERYELQLKGAGTTPFSRFADGKALFSSSLREFVISESLNAIGIPSTRALAISVLPRTYAMRARHEKCAVVCRMAPSWVRIGTFDLYKWRGDRKGLIELSDYVIDEVFKNKLLTDQQVWKEVEKQVTSKNIVLTRYDKMYLEIVARNAKTTALWHVYGFLNGVLNTDNTSVLGLSLDFGPFAFMEYFSPDYTSNHEDSSKRYSFANTPSAIWYNLVKLGEDVAELIGADQELLDAPDFNAGIKEEWMEQMMKRANVIIDIGASVYEKLFMDDYLNIMCKRIGISPRSSDHSEVLAPMFEMLQATKIDYNGFFKTLQSVPLTGEVDYDSVAELFVPDDFQEDLVNDYTKENILKELKSFLAVFKNRVDQEGLSDGERLARASSVNPLFVPKNWMLNEVIEYTVENDLHPDYIDKMIKMATNPYDSTKWGDELPEVQKRWCSDVRFGLKMEMRSCAS
ncbi:hypothetical protein OGAPHI_006260 [Ogataea philodendri]|uniref:Selenoprotein O n=1 Tax=Ogataea philodendri TaxID=1378263 RepID=A0A9P8NZ11_9ASCO|nr:uncharacterized protein OGAPHI_006260 [Ogataea philodendri]KAH3662079.1 hypothetical protein OGAPHI_006260 [Ogataea philodendri]